jgi:aspartyl-tRNA(Asn)/glutamyl-tRNA(Gln) amidotransferase subunit B
MPEFPGAMRERFVRDYGLAEYDAAVSTQSKAMGSYYEVVVVKASKEQAKPAANWLMSDVGNTVG